MIGFLIVLMILVVIVLVVAAVFPRPPQSWQFALHPRPPDWGEPEGSFLRFLFPVE